MDLNFEQLLAQHNQEFKEAEVYSSWMPPDEDYIVSLIKLETGQKTKDGVATAWWKLTGRIEVEKTCPQDVQQADKLAGKEFTVGFYTSKAYGILKGAARTLANNPQLDDLAEAHAVLEAAIGDVVRVRIKTSWSDKYKKDFTNCYILDVINTTEASAEETPRPDDGYSDETPAVEPDGITEEAPAEVPAEAPTE